MKKMLVALILVIVLLTTFMMGCEFTPNNNDNIQEKEEVAAVFTIDVNPGVRVYVREDNTVIDVEATNEDGEEIVEDLDIEEVDYETLLEEIINKMEEKGYLEGDESSVLISVEKKQIDISEKINEKINEAFEKHGKRAAVIEQELDELNKEMEKAIDEMAEKYHISKGKAHLIERIREEFPELSEEELAGLRVNELAMMLEDTSDDTKSHFKKIDKPVEGDYFDKEQVIATVLEELEISLENITLHHVRATRGEGKMLYEVEFIYDGMKYEIIVDAKTGEILSTESKEFEEFDAEGFINDFCDKHGHGNNDMKDQIMNDIFGKNEHNGEHGGEHIEKKVLSRGDLLNGVIEFLNISEDSLAKTDVKLYETKNGTLYSVMVETNNGDVYMLVVEAYNGTILKAEVNGAEITVSADSAE